MCDSHDGGGLVASLYAAMLAEGNIEALVNKRLVGVVIVGQQSLLELALIHEDSLKMPKKEREREREGSVNLMTDTGGTSQHMHGFHVTFTLADSLPTKHALRETGGGGMLLQKKCPFQMQIPASCFYCSTHKMIPTNSQGEMQLNNLQLNVQHYTLRLSKSI